MVEATATIELDRCNIYANCDAVIVVKQCPNTMQGWLINRSNFREILRVCLNCLQHRTYEYEFATGRTWPIYDSETVRILEMNMKIMTED